MAAEIGKNSSYNTCVWSDFLVCKTRLDPTISISTEVAWPKKLDAASRDAFTETTLTQRSVLFGDAVGETQWMTDDFRHVGEWVLGEIIFRTWAILTHITGWFENVIWSIMVLYKFHLCHCGRLSRIIPQIGSVVQSPDSLKKISQVETENRCCTPKTIFNPTMIPQITYPILNWKEQLNIP